MKFKEGDWVKYWSQNRQHWIRGQVTTITGNVLWSHWDVHPREAWMNMADCKPFNGLEIIKKRHSL